MPKTDETDKNLDSKAKSLPNQPRGTLLLIGGGEDRKGEKRILQCFAQRAGGGAVAVITAASSDPHGLFEEYLSGFRDLGVDRIAHIHVEGREQGADESLIEKIRSADGIFFSGGDQARFTSKVGGTLICDAIRERYEEGAIIGGTSSGASIMPETMIVGGDGDESHRIQMSLMMAPGLGLLGGVIVDQQFAQRGRIGRLLGAVAQNPRILGLGIDEDTAVLFDGAEFKVLGSGAVYVADARAMTYTNISEEEPDRVMSAFDIKIHVLSDGDKFNFDERRPAPGRSDEGASKAA